MALPAAPRTLCHLLTACLSRWQREECHPSRDDSRCTVRHDISVPPHLYIWLSKRSTFLKKRRGSHINSILSLQSVVNGEEHAVQGFPRLQPKIAGMGSIKWQKMDGWVFEPALTCLVPSGIVGHGIEDVIINFWCAQVFLRSFTPVYAYATARFLGFPALGKGKVPLNFLWTGCRTRKSRELPHMSFSWKLHKPPCA